jgi:hypothetical protein
MLDLTDKGSIPGQIDIFAFENSGAGHLDSYQHMESFDGRNIEFRSQSGEKHVFICTDGQREVYGWAGVNSFESLDKIYLDLRKERRDALCATAEGIINAGSGIIHHMELRKMASEVVLRSIRCDFSGTGYEGETISDVCVYLTNVNTQCALTADGHIVPMGTANQGGLEPDDVESFREPDMIFREMREDIGRRSSIVGMSFICYPNTSVREGPGTPFTRLVIEGKIRGETFWWPIDINREDGIEEPGIHRCRQYIYDVTITRKGSHDPDKTVETDAVKLQLSIKPWEEKDRYQVSF